MGIYLQIFAIFHYFIYNFNSLLLYIMYNSIYESSNNRNLWRVYMKKTNKGFTLIELLVVVAIIGALAAVGVVAYNGYTAAAKKNSTKSVHANIVKYVASELAKCNLDTGSEIFGGTDVTCASTAADIATHLTGDTSPLQDKDPYDGGDAAVGETPSEKAEGNTVIIAVGDDITFKTVYSKGTPAGDDPVANPAVEGESLENKVRVE